MKYQVLNFEETGQLSSGWPVSCPLDTRARQTVEATESTSPAAEQPRPVLAQREEVLDSSGNGWAGKQAVGTFVIHSSLWSSIYSSNIS